MRDFTSYTGYTFIYDRVYIENKKLIEYYLAEGGIEVFKHHLYRRLAPLNKKEIAETLKEEIRWIENFEDEVFEEDRAIGREIAETESLSNRVQDLEEYFKWLEYKDNGYKIPFNFSRHLHWIIRGMIEYCYETFLKVELTKISPQGVKKKFIDTRTLLEIWKKSVESYYEVIEWLKSADNSTYKRFVEWDEHYSFLKWVRPKIYLKAFINRCIELKYI